MVQWVSMHETLPRAPKGTGLRAGEVYDWQRKHMTLGVDDSLLESAAACLGPDTVRALGEIQLSEATRCRIALLAEKANEGLLTPEEGLEYERFIEVSEIIATLRLKAMRRMQPPVSEALRQQSRPLAG